MARRTRQGVVDSAGVEHVQAKPPRVDVLHYPAHDVTTVLVRRTHDLALARQLAEDRWAELERDGLVDQPLGLDERAVRVGWWQTLQINPRNRLDSDAVDDQHRTIRPCLDTAPGGGAGVEHRP